MEPFVAREVFMRMNFSFFRRNTLIRQKLARVLAETFPRQMAAQITMLSNLTHHSYYIEGRPNVNRVGQIS